MKKSVAKKGVLEVLTHAAKLSEGKTIEVRNDSQELPGITLNMYSWWFHNNSTSFRYRMWHPSDHISISREIPPKENSDNGMVILAEVKFGKFTPSILRIRSKYVVSKSANNIAHHSIYSCILDSHNNTISWINLKLFETQRGIKIQSTFGFPADIPKDFISSQQKHIKEENAHLVRFLPILYRNNMELNELLKIDSVTGKKLN